MGTVGILTFHRCVNYGSYWQARCLVEWVARRKRAVLLDHVSLAARHAELHRALSPQQTREDVPAYAQKIRGFRRAVERLPLSSRFPLDAPEKAESCDVILIGSDEVFNLRHPWYGGAPAFFGEGFASPRIAYAASFGNGGALDQRWSAKLANFSAISVRDLTSRKLLGHAGCPGPEIVLDPCLLNPPAGEAATKDFVAVYGHGFPNWFAEATRDWARTRGFKLVSIGYRNSWADEQRIGADPEEFRDLMASCAAVATGFFHGCVFALVHKKPFVCVATPYRETKLRDLCALLGIEARLAIETTAVDQALSSPLGAEIDQRIAAMRAKSQAFLNHALEL
jgi:polysaccharide pyruvyl transferase WcaK-like protein